MATNPIWTDLLDEIRPIAIHAVVVLFLDAMLLVVGGMTRLLELLLPTRTSFYEYIELVDIWTALALLCMFAGYTLIVVARSLYQGIRSQ